jgi:hypothetical protein
MYRTLLDEQALANQFQISIEAIDEWYEVSLSTNQQYPVSYFSCFVSPHQASLDNLTPVSNNIL